MKLSPRKLAALRTEEVSASVGNRIAAAARIAEISQADLSRETGFTPQYVSDVARGRYPNITIDNARKFAEVFGCQIEDLFPAATSEVRA